MSCRLKGRRRKKRNETEMAIIGKMEALVFPNYVQMPAIRACVLGFVGITNRLRDIPSDAGWRRKWGLANGRALLVAA